MEYITIKDEVINEIEIEKSRFICHIKRINTKEEADEYIQKINKLHYKATHYCYCYSMYSPNYQKCSDDGEPQGTAGVPMLDAIKKANINNVVAVVTRYFGGIKLGAGGLIRAYTNAVSQALNNSKFLRIKEYTHIEIEFDYNLINIFEKYFNQNNIKAINKEYDLTVKYLFYTDDVNIKETLSNLSLGKVKFVNEYLDYIEEVI